MLLFLFCWVYMIRAQWFMGFIQHKRQNGRHFTDDIVKCIFSNENVWIQIKISLKFVSKGPINNIPALVQIMTWRRPGDKPLPKPMTVRLPTHSCVTRPQWVNYMIVLAPVKQPWTIWVNSSLLNHVNVYLLIYIVWDIDGVVQERRNRSAFAMELRLPCTKPSIWVYHNAVKCLENWEPSPYINRLSGYDDSHYKDETVMWPSYFYNGNSYAGKRTYFPRDTPRLALYGSGEPEIEMPACTWTATYVLFNSLMDFHASLFWTSAKLVLIIDTN